MQRTFFQVLLFYVSVAVTGGLCLNTVVLYNVPVLSLGMKERVLDASELLRGREQVEESNTPCAIASSERMHRSIYLRATNR